MDVLTLLLVGLFLPLFPLSMVFNLLLARADEVRIRAALLLLWPLAGVGLLALTDTAVPGWLMVWAAATSALYAFRALALRDLGLWIGFLATSSWSLLWLAAAADSASLPYVQALGAGVPLMLLTLLGAGLRQRFGAAYTGLYGGLTEAMPRFSFALVLVVLAVVATPLFPGFFALLQTLVHLSASGPGIAVAVVLVWLLWSWAGARLLQGFLVGHPPEGPVADIGPLETSIHLSVLAALVVGGLCLLEGYA